MNSICNLYVAGIFVVALKESVLVVTCEKMNEKENLICTKLHSAIQERNLEKTKFLLKSGADVNSKNKLNLAPIHFAVWTGDLRFLKILVEHGADLDAKDLYGYTALHLAVLNNDCEAVKCLISNGASISLADNSRKTPLQYAFESNSLEIFSFLIKQASQETKDNFMINASEINQISKIEILLKNEANVEARLNIDMTHLNKLILALGPPLATEVVNKSCLSWALERNSVELAKLLMSYGADIDFKDPNGQSLLHIAVIRSKSEFVQILIKAGASLYMKNEDAQ